MLAVNEIKSLVGFPAHCKGPVNGEHFNCSHGTHPQRWSFNAVGKRGIRQKQIVLPCFHFIESRGR